MKGWILTLMLALTPWTLAQSLDVEVGQEIGFSVAPAAYALVRYNLPLGNEVWGSQFWLLPEAGVWLTTPLRGYLRVQLLLDMPIATLFADCRSDGTASSCRVGLRLSL